MAELLKEAGVFHRDRNSYVLGKEPMIFHCHHYNVFLQMSIEDTQEYIDARGIMVYSAQEIAYSQFETLFSEQEMSVEERKALVENVYKTNGFGIINLSNCDSRGGVIETNSEHYAVGWKEKFGLRNDDQPGVSFFSTGFVAGALEAVYGLELGSLAGSQTKCLTKGDDVCRFEVTENSEKLPLERSPGEGKYQTFKDYPQPEGTDVDYSAIREALINMPKEGDENGLINAFGVLLTRHYANYYTLMSIRVLMSMKEEFGDAGVDIVKDLLTEAGHVCAFHTLGGIMESSEWDALVRPMIKDRDDWLHGILGVANAMGWGLWSLHKLDVENVSSFYAISAYESNSYAEILPQGLDFPTACFVAGGIAGIMNLIYHGDITESPELSTEYYEKTFKTPGRFVSRQVKSRNMGDKLDAIAVKRA
jgi:hypothetical protein